MFACSTRNRHTAMPPHRPLSDASDPATDWQGEHSLDQLPSVMNPGSGFAFTKC